MRAVASGQKQREIAEDLGISIAKLQRCVVLVRHSLAETDNDLVWLQSTRRTGVQVAQRWLRLFRASAAE